MKVEERQMWTVLTCKEMIKSKKYFKLNENKKFAKLMGAANTILDG